MGAGGKMQELEEYRKQLDGIDEEIIKLYEERMKRIDGVTEYKIAHQMEVLDSKREERKLAAVSALTKDPSNREGSLELFRVLMAISRKKEFRLMGEAGIPFAWDFQEREKLNFTNAKVVFQGVRGAYSFVAMRSFFGDFIQEDHVDTWSEAMQAVARREADYAVLPIENSTAGSVSDMYDLLLDFDNVIAGEQVIRVDHMLMAAEGTGIADIRRVYSHPQGLLQCKDFLDQHPDWERIPVLNTAMAAEKISKEERSDQAAIAGKEAAAFFGLHILKDKGLSSARNVTRFLIVTNQRIYTKDARKISICFGLPHSVGTLYNILSHISFNQLNMTKIESRPVPEQPFTYRFFVDFEGNLNEAAVQNALRGISGEASGFRLLGNY